MVVLSQISPPSWCPQSTLLSQVSLFLPVAFSPFFSLSVVFRQLNKYVCDIIRTRANERAQNDHKATKVLSIPLSLLSLTHTNPLSLLFLYILKSLHF